MNRLRLLRSLCSPRQVFLKLAVFRLCIDVGELCSKEEDLSRVIDPHH